MPTSASLTNAPVTKFFLVYIVASALVATATDTKYYLPLEVSSQVFPGSRFAGLPGSGRQLWRCVTWATAYTNSTEVLFAALSVWQLRIIERIWGSRKFLTFIITTLPYTILIPPALLCILYPLTGGLFDYLPSGPTALIFALLAQYHASVPYTFRYQVSAFSNRAEVAQNQQQENAEDTGIMLTSKSTSYIPALQLALSQLPGSLLPALVGWLVGYAWRGEFLPMSARFRAWRVPGWIIGEKWIDSPAPSGTQR